MKYVILVSHGTFATGLHNAVSMLAGSNREDFRSTGLKDGMGSDEFAGHVRECLKGITAEDEILLFGDLVGGSPLTTAANVIAQEGLMGVTSMVGGMNLPLVLSAVLEKDSMDTAELTKMILEESREQIKQFEVECEDAEEDI